MEDLYTELVREGIVIRCPKTRLSEYVGEYRYNVASTAQKVFVCIDLIYILHSFLATTLTKSGIEPMPSVYDVKRLVTEHCILPMG